MRLDDFDYDLPEDLIALRPALSLILILLVSHRGAMIDGTWEK